MSAPLSAGRLVRLDLGAHGPGVATITLDSPANRNALSTRVRRELAECLDWAISDEAVRVILLDHTGRVFCSGMDLKESRGAGADDQGVHEFPALLTSIWESPKPVVAKLAGPARAGGVGLVAACDLAIASRSVTFAFPEVRIGVVPAVISVPVLRRVHPRAAQELFLTGEVFGAERAAAIGLITAAVADDDLDAEVRRYTDMLRLGAPAALAGAKELLRREPGGMAADFREMTAIAARYFASEDGQEGIRAFAEKRAPSWAVPR
ncbi:enoyl-CoA hydratase-related protein [Streptomyces albipurpureus]|uniref:Enoyl-CoA hydratase-related protein n=1 Tax=Streptomyces albipurpureus TaxID=2897419 RepID=A0ABT0UG21_9ACTN|nr:enoyl-CoA hydratase-related protein [Streptomyces sp. CWNU-1]MCM2387574.1 enoyl-CoA hydratase-related protein [Streptomyces sp. CWNU-1]